MDWCFCGWQFSSSQYHAYALLAMEFQWTFYFTQVAMLPITGYLEMVVAGSHHESGSWWGNVTSVSPTLQRHPVPNLDPPQGAEQPWITWTTENAVNCCTSCFVFLKNQYWIPWSDFCSSVVAIFSEYILHQMIDCNAILTLWHVRTDTVLVALFIFEYCQHYNNVLKLKGSWSVRHCKCTQSSLHHRHSNHSYF